MLCSEQGCREAKIKDDSVPKSPEKNVEKQPLISLMRKTFGRMGDKTAIIFVRGGRPETEISFGQLDLDSDLLALRFMEIGVGKGDRAIIYLPKCAQWVIAHLALQKIGAIGVPLNPAFKRHEMEFFLAETSPALAVVGIDQEETIREVDPNLALWSVDAAQPYSRPPRSECGESLPPSATADIDDPAMIIFTSGTTGRPKGAVLTQGNLGHDAQNVIGIWEIGPNDRFCHALPLFHVHGLCFGLHTCLLAGATTILLDSFDPGVVLDILSHGETTMFMGVPAMYSGLIQRRPDAEVDYSHIRLLTSGSAPLPERDFARIKAVFGKEPVEREGMSETLMNFSNPLDGVRKPGSIGLPLPHLQARIVDPKTFEEVAPGEVGEIRLKSPAITPGYWRNREETEKAFVDGWFRTGDLGRQDADGYYYLTDRIKNIIISGGENISPKEIETVLNAHDEIRESCVVGIPDATWGEAVVAAIVLMPGSSLAPDDARTFCRERLLDWKCPKTIRPLNGLPRNQMGKVLRDKVREFFIEK